MALNYVKPHTDVGSGVVTVDKRLYLTEDKERLVEDGHPDARWLWCTPGTQVPREQAERYGLLEEPEPEPEPEVEREAEEEPPVQPKRRTPAANKARTRAADK